MNHVKPPVMGNVEIHLIFFPQALQIDKFQLERQCQQHDSAIAVVACLRIADNDVPQHDEDELFGFKCTEMGADTETGSAEHMRRPRPFTPYT